MFGCTDCELKSILEADKLSCLWLVFQPIDNRHKTIPTSAQWRNTVRYSQHQTPETMRALSFKNNAGAAHKPKATWGLTSKI